MCRWWRVRRDVRRPHPVSLALRRGVLRDLVALPHVRRAAPINSSLALKAEGSVAVRVALKCLEMLILIAFGALMVVTGVLL